MHLSNVSDSGNHASLGIYSHHECRYVCMYVHLCMSCAVQVETNLSESLPLLPNGNF